MIFSRINRKSAFAIIAILLLVIIGLVVYSVIKAKQPEVSIETVSTTKVTPLNVDYGVYSNKFTTSDKASIDEAVASYIKQTVNKSSNAGNVIARAGSYEKTLFEGTIPKVALLFDVKKINRTYKMTLDGGPSYEFNILYVRCAPQNQQLDPSVECKDAEV